MPEALPIRNYTNDKKKWTSVVVFETIPRDNNPRVSKEAIELAKFTHRGDAWVYAMNLAKDPGSYYDAWAIVLR